MTHLRTQKHCPTATTMICHDSINNNNNNRQLSYAAAA